MSADSLSLEELRDLPSQTLQYLRRKIHMLKNVAASSLASASTMSISHPSTSSSLTLSHILSHQTASLLSTPSHSCLASFTFPLLDSLSQT